ncbi:hypothetical protein [Lysobacter brunescens]|uniref:Uncharacterized protein n=1 Tax=Lysobacter brunescens TaxID=262323 RepID=A0ABW2YET7_9GAMM
MNSDNACVTATQDALMVIAGASGTASRELRPGLSLTVDLGLDDAGLALVAGYLQRIAERIGRDMPATPLDTDALRDTLVWQAVAAMFAQAGRDEFDADAIRRLIATALGRLRGTVADGD